VRAAEGKVGGVSWVSGAPGGVGTVAVFLGGSSPSWYALTKYSYRFHTNKFSVKAVSEKSYPKSQPEFLVPMVSFLPKLRYNVFSH
jgi:hypothetical protein